MAELVNASTPPAMTETKFARRVLPPFSSLPDLSVSSNDADDRQTL
jgi:hypothetical protein